MIVVQLIMPFAMSFSHVGLFEFHGLLKVVPQVGLGLARGLFQVIYMAFFVSHGRPPFSLNACLGIQCKGAPRETMTN